MRNDHLAPRPSPIEVGEVAPDFTLSDQNRQEWHLADRVKAGDVVLCFVPLAFTGVCSTEMKCIESDFETWTAKGATVVGVNCDSFAANKAWAEREGYRQVILGDMHRNVCKAYGLYWSDLNVSQRATVVIGKSETGVGRVKFVQARPPGQAMNWSEVLAQV